MEDHEAEVHPSPARAAAIGDLDPTEPEQLTTAHDRFRELRSTCPVAHSEAFGGFWALLRHADVAAALRRPSTYITSVQNVVPKVAFTGRRPPLHLDPPEHTPYRQVINRFFTDERVRDFEPTLRRLVVELLDPFVAAGGGDLCDVAQHLPGRVFGQLFNLPAGLAETIEATTARYNRALQEADDATVKATSLELYEVAKTIVELRRHEPLDPADDLPSALLAKVHDGAPLPPELVLGTIRQMIVVGMIAPSVVIGTIAVHLSEHPALADRLRREPGLTGRAVEEYLRLYTPYRGFARTATHDVTIAGRTIPAGEPIALVYASANRDEAVFGDGDRFVLDRPNIGEHLAFGGGPHRCAGEALARSMLRVVVEELLARTRSLEVTGEVVMTRWPEWGTLSVPLRVVPA
ncbi:MAG: cytochrome P450 [Actinomycetota bacterium]|nr:cytochrome P450 [Actinomycetota bacterium]